MNQTFSKNSFDEKDLKCTDCNWSGKGNEAVVIDLYGVTDYQEVHCPKCDSLLGTIKKEDDPDGESATELSFQIG